MQIKSLFELFLDEEIKGEESDINTLDKSQESVLLQMVYYLFKVANHKEPSDKRGRNNLIDKRVIWSNHWRTRLMRLTVLCITIETIINVIYPLCLFIYKLKVITCLAFLIKLKAITCLVFLIKLTFLLCVLMVLLITLIYLWRFLCQLF